MASYLRNAEFFFQQSRIEEAANEIKKELAINPNNDYALALLANCNLFQKRPKRALELAQQAFSLSPNSIFNIMTLARTYFLNQNIGKAKWVIAEGQKVNPNEPEWYSLLSQIGLYEQKWEEALQAAEIGLELDPEDVTLINLRSQALVKLKRKSDASIALDYALHKAPEDSYSHANKGWVAIEQGTYEEAVEHFKEALRLDPSNDYARSGLKEAIKAKNILYRFVLRYFLWMNKLQDKGQWAVIIGAYLLYRGVWYIYDHYPSLGLICIPVIVFYLTFVFAGWIGQPFSNLFLRFHSLGKKALTRDEILGSNIVGGLLGLSLALFAGSVFTGQEELSGFLFWLFVFSGLMLIPVGGIFAVSPGTKTRRGLVIYTLLITIFGLAFTLTDLSIFFYVFLIGFIGYQFVANYLISRDSKVLIRSLEE